MATTPLETPSQPIAQTQKRWHERNATPEFVRLTWRDKTGQEQAQKCRILDLSKLGMRVSLPYKLEFRTFIHVSAPQLRLTGTATVRHQKPEGREYMTGLEFVGGLVYKADDE